MLEFLMANKDSEILPAEDAHDIPCDFNELLSNMEQSCFTDKFPVYLKSCEPLSVTDPDPEPSNNVGEPNIPRTDALVTLSNSIVLTESSEPRDNDGNFSSKINQIKRSSTRKSTRKISSNQKTDIKLAMRKSRRTSGKKPMLDLFAADVGRGRRSNMVRRARPLAWGLGGKIDEIFKQYAENNVNANERIELRNGRAGCNGEKQIIQNSQDESRALNKGLLLKFKLGTKAIQNCQINTIPDMDKDLDIYREFKNEASTSQSDIKDNYVKEVNRTSNGNLDKQTESPKSPVIDVLLAETKRSEIHKITGIGESVENIRLDPGTSPDSEVINVIPETQVSGNTSEDIRISSKDCISHQIGDCGIGSRIPSPEIANDVLLCEKQIEGSWSSGASMSITTGIAFSNTSTREGCPLEPLRETDVEVSMDMLAVESVMKADFSIVGVEPVESKSNGQDFQKSSKSKLSVNKNRTNCRQNGYPAKSTAMGKVKEKSDKNQAYCDIETHSVTGTREMNYARGLEESSRTTEPLSNSTMLPSEGESRQGSPRSAWVCCDDCHKWRRISAVLADSIDSTQCRWICKDNMDKVFADCSIPQEKSNADINEELELSEASCEEDASNTRLNSSQLVQKQPIDPPQSAWKLIKTNMFLHRSRKNQPIDEVMVCHCKPPIDGRMGCRDECLNRMLNIECVKGTCPCGEFCSNQHFQKRKYSNLKHFPSGKKGYGLQLLEDIPKGRFLIEYVGEVLDMPAYESRQKEYASKGYKHFYFMTLNGSEVIDACAKGNLGRFINHSCEPNCGTEKWMVNGEVCIGLFAIRDIKKGEELTFDYNYVRVFGAAAKKCVCGSSRCRGVIGGDLLNDETIVLGDSDDEYPDPVTFYGNCNNKVDNVSVTQTGSTFKNDVENDQSPDSLLVTDDDPAILIESTEREVSFERSSSATSVSENKTEHTKGLLPSCAQPLNSSFKVSIVKSEIKQQNENTTLVNFYPEDGDSKKKPKSHTNEKKCTVLKPQSRSKLHSPSSAVKKGKSKSKQPEIDSMPIVVPQKPKKLVVDNLTGRFEAVEEALNTLLSKGGISKRRDAWKGYLMLLCVTANGGNGEGIQSNRDLSMILDALLRTKSRTVLLDIINKNGLQLLHILLKRYRKVFSKTPILRKLLKVLEFLAETKILTLDNILKPSLNGGESFKESILSLTEHADKEVRQIARSFRDRYIPWYARRVNRAERDTERMEFQQTLNPKSFPLQHSQERRPSEDKSIKQPVSGPKPLVDGSSVSCVSSCTDGTRIQKRKSRWDEPGDIEYPSKKDFRSKISRIGEQHENMDVDAPPGFSSPVNRQLFQSIPSSPSTVSHRCKTVMGQPQDRYISRLPTAFGVPCSLIKKIGTPDDKGDGAATESWIVAPAMTFHPFPPLPVYPRGDNPHVKEEQSWRNCNVQRDRNPNTLGKRYFKQQKWNNSRAGCHQWNHPNKFGPAGFNGPNQNQPNIGVGYGENNANGPYNTGFCQQQHPHH